VSLPPGTRLGAYIVAVPNRCGHHRRLGVQPNWPAAPRLSARVTTPRRPCPP